MKPVYLALTFAIATLMGCSNEKINEPVTSTSSEQEGVSTVDAKKYEPCVIPEVEGYQQVGCLRDGLAGVIGFNEADPYTMSNRVGYIDENGKVIIPFEYDAILTGEGGEALTFNDFSEGLVAVVKNDKYGFIDSKGAVVVPLQYEWASNFSDGLAVVRDNELYGAIDKTGKVVIPIEYASLGDFNDGFAAAAYPAQDMNYQYGLINKDNKEVIPFMYEQMGRFSEGLVAVQKDGKWGYVDQSNKPVIAIDLDYEQVNDFSSGLAAVFSYKENSDNMKYGYIDKTGQLVIPMNFTRIFWQDSEGKIDFKNGYAIVNDDEGEEFCIDTKGKKAECPEGIDSAHWYSSNDEYAAAEVMTEEQQAAVDSDGARFSSITDYLALKPSQQWTWDQLSSIPDVQEWRNKTPVKDQYQEGSSNFLIEARLTDTGFMTAYGTQKEPKIIVLSSGQGFMEDEALSGVYEIADFFNLNELVRIKSNCDVDGMFDQKFYKWQKKGFQPLYVSSSYMGGNAGSESKFGIAESIDEFFSSKYDDSFRYLYLGLQSVDQNYDDVVCTFDE